MKKFVSAVVLIALMVFVVQADPPRGGSSSSKPGSSSSSKPSSPPSSGGSRPKYGSSGSSGGSTKTEPPKTGGTSTPKSKYGSGSGGSSTPATPPSTGSSSGKPSSGGSAKAQANREQASKKKYEEQHKATAPPKTEYKTANGKSVKIDPNDKVVNDIRNRPSSWHEPEARRTRYVDHVTVYHYHHPYSYYHTQPVVYVGGGYSSAFWWMMMEWDAERRARWFYNNRDRIESDAYSRGVRDAQVQAHIAKWEAEKRARQTGYVDPEFAKDPSMQYDDDFIAASYNPTPRVHHPAEPSNAGTVLLWMLVVILGVGAVIGILVFVSSVRFGR